MGRMNVNSQNLLCVKLLQLRRHLNSCRKCRSARKAREYKEMCPWSQHIIIEIAIRWGNNIAGRLAARNGMHDYIYPCPDPNAHGPAYALTAEACILAGNQEGLF